MSKPTRIASETSEVSVASFPTRNRNKNIRKPAKEPLRPIGLRFEYMTEQKTHLTLYPGGSAVSECAYSIQDENGAVLFTSGLPLFEIHQRSRWVRNTWTVSLPGCRTTPIAIGRHSLGGDLHLELENLIQVDCNVKERNLPIDLESHGRVLTMYDVVDDNRRIMEIKESIRHNKKLALLSFCQAGYRPAMDMVIMPGMDMATAVAIAVIVSASSFPAHRSCYVLYGTKRHQVIQETKDITVLNQKGIEQIVQHLNQKDRLDLMKWISPTNTAMKQDDKLKLWLNGTGRWFLEPNEFGPWSNQDQDQTMWRTLFCPSAPGTGKTLMISGVIGEIQIVAYGTIVRSDWRISTATIARD
ncbi:hypothetical protein CBS147332_7108 [Penicillium roqueforti]|nr:hypothetical protein CBS147332_7108 [Penicillium roqueforti]KAI3101131.1 hypothetical protein CBS147331_8154 [Penicillium roqueforti]